MTYQFYTKAKATTIDFTFSANSEGDFTITSTATGKEQVVLSSKFMKRKYTCFEQIVSEIFREYPANTSIYFTAAGSKRISAIVNGNKVA